MTTRANDLDNWDEWDYIIRQWDARRDAGEEQCAICHEWYKELEMDYDDGTGFHCCQQPNCLFEFWWDDSEEEAESEED